ncbi:hypothetical protein EGW08_020705, partial [Elysia chlorotica]
ADGEEDEDHERQCQELLLKLKRTTESLLARQSVSGTWTTYGALRRIVDDTENILSHRIRRASATPGSEGSYWGFVQGLKWLCPTLASMIDKVNRHSGALRGGATGSGGRSQHGSPEAARAWLTESVQDHSFVPQIDVLVGNREHLLAFYHEDAFLCQTDHVRAMRVCFRAIELNRPALLTDISPHLLRQSDRKLSDAVFRRSGFETLTGASRAGTFPVGSDIPNGRAGLTRTFSARERMGNKHPRLDASYSGQLSRSNLSLTVDPSLGASSLLHQKTLSSPYFVSSLDSPRVLQNLHGDIRDALRPGVTGGAHSPGVGSVQRLYGDIRDAIRASTPGVESVGSMRVDRTVDQSNELQGHVLDGSESNSNSSDTIARPQHDRATQDWAEPLSDYARDTASEPDLRVVPETKVVTNVTGQRRATVIASGPHATTRSGQVDQSGSDSTSSSSTLSCSHDDVVGSGRTHSRTIAGDGSRESARDGTTVCEPGSNPSCLRPKSLSNVLQHSHRTLDTLTNVTQCGTGSSSIPGDNAFPTDVSVDNTTHLLSQSTDRNTNGQMATTNQSAKEDRTPSHVSAALDATCLNTNLTCQTDYGPDGVLFGFSPPEKDSERNSCDNLGPRCNTDVIDDDEVFRQDVFKVTDLPEPGDSPSGSPVNTTVPLSDNSDETHYQPFSPRGGARPKVSLAARQSEPTLAISDPLLSPSPPTMSPTMPSSSPSRRPSSAFNFPQLSSHSPQSGGAYSSSPSLYSGGMGGVRVAFSEAESDLYCFSPPISPRTTADSGESITGGRRGSEQTMGSTNSVSVPVKLPGGGVGGGTEGGARNGGRVYIPGRAMGMSLDRGLPGISALASASYQADDDIASARDGTGSARGVVSDLDPLKVSATGAQEARNSSVAMSSEPRSAARKGHKRWVSDTTVIKVNQLDLLAGERNSKQSHRG